MLDINGLLRNLTRPSILIKAAQHGIDDYNRSVHLRRILGRENLPKSGRAVIEMLEIEHAMNEGRKEKRATYSVARHVEILAAIMAEAKTLQASMPPR